MLVPFYPASRGMTFDLCLHRLVCSLCST